MRKMRGMTDGWGFTCKNGTNVYTGLSEKHRTTLIQISVPIKLKDLKSGRAKNTFVRVTRVKGHTMSLCLSGEATGTLLALLYRTVLKQKISENLLEKP